MQEFYPDALPAMALFTQRRIRGPTASLMRNDLLNTACRVRIDERKGYKVPKTGRTAPEIEVAVQLRANTDPGY
jgi:hypothetical protein